MTLTKFKARPLASAALLLALCFAARAQQTGAAQAQPAADAARVERLVGLAKVWGAVKYFHPYLAYRELDWDKALVEAIPKVNAAGTPEEYSAALNQMLAALGDPSTRAEIEVEAKNTPPTQAPAVEPVRTENGVLFIDATRLAATGARDNAAFRVLLGKFGEAAPSAKAVVIDARAAGPPDAFAAYFFADLMRQVLSQLLDSNVTLGHSRFRLHNGYATQAGGASFYYSAFADATPQTLLGARSTSKSPPIVFVVNEHTPPAAETLGGLQYAGRAYVVQDGERAPEAGGGSFTLELPGGVKARLRTSESVNPDGSIGFAADAVVPKGAGEDAAMREALRAAQEGKVSQVGRKTSATPAPLVGQKEQTYPEMEFPTAEYRLLALFRYWNVINYFYPYKHLIEDTWATVLPRYIPKFEADRDAADYQLTVRELVTEMHDSHGSVQNANASAERLGTYQPPVVVRYVEGQTVVTNVLDDKLPVKVGDVVLTVDGEPVAKRIEFLARYTAASTPQALMRVVHLNLLRGQKETPARLRVRGADGTERDVELPRSIGRADQAKLFTVMQRSTPVVQVLPSGYGYVDLARLQAGEVDKMFETIKDTPAVVFDMRGYPNGTAWPIAPRLTEKRMPVAALFSRPLLEGASLSDLETESPSYTFAQRLPERRGDVYRGKVVVLINEDAISQAEHTCMFFEAATDVTFVGTPTTGANGDVTFMVLPGNLNVSFTGHNVRHADGRQLQRVGIQPHVKVAPTIAGIIDGRDEVLEAAVRHLQTSLKK